MRKATELMVQYAAYHRDRRNIATHFVGIPLIVFAIGVLLARPAFELGGLAVSPAWIVWALGTAWYLTRGNLILGAATAFVSFVLFGMAHQVAHGSTASWLAWGVGSFVVGWVAQFIGHYYEGRKPAFVDDLVGLLVGPMFVVLEMLALLGLFKGLMAQIEAHAGPTLIRDLAHPATR